jgi:hypothetical protein
MQYRTIAGLVVLGLLLGCSDAGDNVVQPTEPAAPGTPDALVVDASDYDLNDPTPGTLDVNGAIWNWPIEFQAGTGNLRPFLTVQNSPVEEGFNRHAAPWVLDQTGGATRNKVLPLNYVPTIKVGDDFYREAILDANESASGMNPYFAIQNFDLYLCDDFDFSTLAQIQAECELVYDLGGNIGRAWDFATAGSGNRADYQILIPELNFETAVANAGFGLDLTDCQYQGTDAPHCGLYLMLYVKFGDAAGGDWRTDATFEEMSTVERAWVNVTKDADPAYTRTWEWDIEKTVTPDTWDLFDGDTGTSEYTVTVTRTGFTDSGLEVSGNIEIVNPSGESVTIISVDDVLTQNGTSVTAHVTCPGGLPQILGAGQTLICTYFADESDGLDNADPWVNTATVELADIGISVGQTNVIFGDPTTEVNATVNVDDTFAGDLGSFSDTGSVSYSRTFACGDDEGVHENTATIVETDQSDDADVAVNCYDLEVTKDATPEFTRTYEWDIEKSSETTELTLQPQQTYDVDYEVTVDVVGFTDSDWAVSGSIYVQNNHPSRSAILTGVADVVSPDIVADVDCPSLTIAPSATLTCTYSADLPNADTRTNTATATQQNHDYDKDGNATASGTTDYSGDATVDFALATMNEVDACVDVADLTFNLPLGEACVHEAPKTFPFTETIGPFEECGPHEFENTAEFVTQDLGETGQDSHLIEIDVPCPEGCTLTLGYWKTHNETFHGGASKKADPTWDLLPGGLAENTIFFLSEQTWFEVFWTSPGGNVYYNLAHQYMAAVLNGLAGADTSEVDAAIAQATTLFETYTPAQVGAWRGNQGERQLFISLANTLDDYNNGLIGPGHCDENGVF